ncbi:hypothetical protein NFA_15150 [Nocardia farcinica IFM 10152]|uniref:Uncharacterized protein n=1 Tax=Nocardia farcinica (strain IFM 10152) TaxID=247156 RepID=Q5YZN1_NOCFA|nr:hypothetical protein NFA_15150 [Nocardia farcinica IFM 10152]
MRKRLARALIRLAHRIYRPRVTVVDAADAPAWYRAVQEDLDRQDPWTRRLRTPEWADLLPPERRESRGWN